MVNRHTGTSPASCKNKKISEEYMKQRTRTLLAILLMVTWVTAVFAASRNISWRSYNTANSAIPENRVNAVKVDDANLRWIGFQEAGMYTFNGSVWHCPLPYTTVTGITFRESDDQWWVSSGDGILTLIDGEIFNYNVSNSNFPAAYVVDIVFDTSDELWAANMGAVMHYDFDTWDFYYPNGANCAQAVEISPEGTLWCGMQAGGLVKFNGSCFEAFTSSNSPLPGDHVYDIHFDDDGVLWASVYGSGLVRFDGMSWDVYTAENSDLPSNYIDSFTLDQLGNPIVPTEDAGLALFDGSEWTVYNTANSGIPTDILISVDWDAEGSILLGTYDAGLVELRLGEPGLVAGIVQDADTGVPIAGVTVTDGRYELAVTAADGYYCFNKVPNIYNLYFEASGYETAIFETVTVPENAVLQLDVSMQQPTAAQPQMPALCSNLSAYPNPFNPTTTIQYSLDAKMNCRVDVYNGKGELVRTLINEEQAAGTHQLQWNGQDSQGKPVASGLYFANVATPQHNTTTRLILLK
jgi:hypothetical protein